jgi:hypothetical protein
LEVSYRQGKKVGGDWLGHAEPEGLQAFPPCLASERCAHHGGKAIRGFYFGVEGEANSRSILAWEEAASMDRLALCVEEWLKPTSRHLRRKPLERRCCWRALPFENKLVRAVQIMENKALAKEGIILIVVEGQACSAGTRAVKVNVTGIEMEISADGPIHCVLGSEMNRGLVKIGTEADGQVADSALPQRRSGMDVTHCPRLSER